MTPYQKLLNIGFLNQVFELGLGYDEDPDSDKLIQLK